MIVNRGHIDAANHAAELLFAGANHIEQGGKLDPAVDELPPVELKRIAQGMRISTLALETGVSDPGAIVRTAIRIIAEGY